MNNFFSNSSSAAKNGLLEFRNNEKKEFRH